MTTDPKRLSPDDLTAEPVRPRVRPAEDLTPEEREEREAFARRRREFERIAGRVRHLNGSERNRVVQAETLASFERQWRLGARTRADERGVPVRDDVRRIALMPEPPPRDAIDAVRAWLAWRAGECGRRNTTRVPAVLVLLSPAGGGKSSAGGWAVTWHRELALFTTAAHVAANPLTAHSSTHAAWSALCAPDLLVIDEISRERDAAALQALYLERDARGRATILLGNRTPSEFAERYVAGDEAIASRFEQQRLRGFDPVVAFAGDDLRALAGEEPEESER